MNDLDKMKPLALIRKVVVAYVLLILIFVLFLTAVAAIPRSAVEKNMQDAAVFLQDKFDVQEITNNKTSVIEYHSNAAMLNIAWNFDPAAPFSSAMRADYYEGGLRQPQAFAQVMQNDAAPDASYARYWYGASAGLKLLMTVLSYRGICLLQAILLAVLLALVIVLAYKRHLYAYAIGIVLGAVATSIWFVPLSFEYAPCILVSLALAAYMLWRFTPGQDWTAFFVVAGALVCYFDTLTAETLSFTLPMLALLAMERENALKKTVRYGITWLLSYGMTYLVKWLIVAAVTGESIADFALANASVRLSGEMMGLGPMPLWQQIGLSVAVNLNFIHPLTGLTTVPALYTALLVIVAILAAVFFVFHSPGSRPAPALLLLAVLPFLRFVVLNNHSAIHPFMTVRSMMATFIAVSLIFAQNLFLPKNIPKKAAPQKAPKNKNTSKHGGKTR